MQPPEHTYSAQRNPFCAALCKAKKEKTTDSSPNEPVIVTDYDFQPSIVELHCQESRCLEETLIHGMLTPRSLNTVCHLPSSKAPWYSSTPIRRFFISICNIKRFLLAVGMYYSQTAK